MYAPRALCSACASRMRLAAAVANARWRAAPAAVCLSSLAPADDGPPTPHAHEQQQQQPASAARRKPPALDAPGKRPPRSPSSSQQSAVALFHDVVNRAPSSSPSSSFPLHSSSAPDAAAAAAAAASAAAPAASDIAAAPRPPALGEWEIAAKLKELVGRPIDAPQRLRIFQTDIWPHLHVMRGQMPRHLYIAALQFLARACDDDALGHPGAAHAAAAQGRAPGSSVQLSSMCARIGKWDLDLRNELVLGLCHSLAIRKHSSAQRHALLTELIDLWKHLSQLRRRSQAAHAAGPPRFVLPSPGEVFGDDVVGHRPQQQQQQQQQHSGDSMDSTRALASIFNQHRIEQARELVPGLLASIAVLSDARLARRGHQLKAAPLLNLAALAFRRHGSLDAACIDQVFGGRIRFATSMLHELAAYVHSQWKHADAMLSDPASPWRQGLDSHRHPTSGLAIFHTQLRIAYGARNTAAIVSVWQDLKARLAQKPGLARQMREDPEFLNYWVFVWCAVRRPAKLQETLALMSDIGLQPSIKTYTAMMHGWKMCKDGDKIAGLWDKLVESGMKLDAFAWTERISGLIEAGRPQAGIQALAEMMALWKQALARQGGADGGDAAARLAAVQPNVEVVNAAFMGLMRLDPRAAHEVLAWAGREGIEPNVRTYNIILSESLRCSGSPAGDVQSLLRAMRRQGIEPDAATFTIILEEVLGGMDKTSAAEQVEAVQQILADIEAAGLRANPETYAKMVYAVSSLANGGADEAIAAVQKHMRAAGLAITPHLVTILIERAMARGDDASGGPSRAAAVGAILREHGLVHVGQGDQTLWERVVSARAAAGEPAAAMAVFRDLARAGRPVTSLPCLEDLLHALLAADLDADAREVVRVVLAYKAECAAAEGAELVAAEEEGASGLGRDARYWRHRFWHMARGSGLLEPHVVPPELQIWLRVPGGLAWR